MSQSPSFEAGEDLAPSTFVKADPANDHTVLLAVLGDEPWGVVHEGSREAPIPGISVLAAAEGESVRVYGDTETCEVKTGTLPILAGDKVAPDANSLGQPAIHGFPFGGKAQAAAAAGEQCRVQVERGIEDKSNVIVTVVQAASPYTVPLRELGAVLTNTGAGDTVVFSLPAALPGYEVRARVDAVQELRLDPNGTDVISLPSTGVPGAAGKYLTANALSETVHLKCNEAGIWDCVSFTGTWTAEA